MGELRRLRQVSYRGGAPAPLYPFSDLSAAYLGTTILHFYNLLAIYLGTTILYFYNLLAAYFSITILS